jgi:hypothetical protein
VAAADGHVPHAQLVEVAALLRRYPAEPLMREFADYDILLVLARAFRSTIQRRWADTPL